MRRAPATWPAVAIAAVLLGFSFFALQHWLEQGQLSDVGVYQSYADLIRGGAVPYRDFAFEYPPAALPVFLLPSWMSWSYATSFAILMGLCGFGCLALAASGLRTVEAGVLRIWGTLLLIAVSPLVLGSLFDTRFDLWPTLLALGGLVALIREKPLLTGGLLGLGFAAKLWPVVLLPIAVAHLWRRRGDGAALSTVAAFAGVAAACFLPFAILAPGGLHAMFADQLDRPLQIESLGAAVLMAAQHLGMAPLQTVTTHGAQALIGHGARLAADVSTVLEIGSVVAVWVWFARLRDASAETVLVASGAAVACLVAFDRVLSPQYLIWLVPFVLLVRGGHGIAAAMLLVLALALTQTWFPWNYWQLALGHSSPWSWYLLARDLALVGLAVALGLALRPARGSGRRTGDWPAVPRAAA